MNVHETLLAAQIAQAGLPEPSRNYRFAEHLGRRWELDFAWPLLAWAIELQGGNWPSRQKDGSLAVGRHVRGKGFEADCEKLVEAALMGWRVLPVTTAMVEDGRALTYIKRAFGRE